jgi:hypothetical protein
MLKKQEQAKIKKSGLKFDVLFGLDKDKESDEVTDTNEQS